MKITVSGSTGFIGQELTKRLADAGWMLNLIDRQSFSLPDTEFAKQHIEGSDAVINLVGATILKRWTEDYKKEIYHSRIDTTRKIAQAIIRSEKKPKIFFSVSASGIYDPVSVHTEESLNFSDDFMGKVCRDWEHEALCAKSVARTIIMRTGIVLGSSGGVLKTMHLPFSIGLGSTVGDGSQSFSWIHIIDLVNAYRFILNHETLSGIVNAVAPAPTTNYHFTKTFGKILNQPAILRIPGFALKILYGEGAAALTSGQNVIPERLLKMGFIFKFPTIEKALADLYRI